MPRSHLSRLILFVGVGCHKVALAFTVPTVPSKIRASIQRTTVQGSQDDDEEFARVPRRRQRGRLYEDKEEEDAFYSSVGRKIFGNDEFDDEDWDDDDDEDEEEEYGLFSDVLIDNPILDNIDPDGAAERFPELARDPRFWIDMVLFISFINFLSAIGPQDYFPDIPYTV